MAGGTTGIVGQMWKAFRQLSPGKVQREVEQHFELAIVATDDEQAQQVREALLGPSPSENDIRRSEQVLRTYIQPLSDADARELRKEAEVILVAGGARAGLDRLQSKLVTFYADDPVASVRAVLDLEAGSKLKLSLAGHLPAFRTEVARRIVREVSLENATFAIGTALGTVVPSVLEPILGAAEAAGDTVFLTANQVRMLFMIAASYGRRVGFTIQWKEISSIIGAAFTWRALARSLVGLIPFGGGLAPKGAIAYAGTFSVGEGLIFFYTTGRTMTRREMREVFRSAYATAVERAREIVNRVRGQKAD